MKKVKTILFIGNNYCSTIEDLRSTLESSNRNNYVGKEGKPLRKEMLAYFKDGLLSNWLVEHGYGKTAKQLPTWKLNDEISDNELFKAIYKVIFGQECTADLESAFSSIAELVYCEVDGTEVPIKNNKIELSEKANEIKFVYKALEEIDSKVCFKLAKPESSSEPWTINSKMDAYPKGSEFSVSFSFDNMGKNREGKYAWEFVSDHKERLYEMEIYGIQRQILLNNGKQLTLYRCDDKKHVFWVTGGFPRGMLFGPPPKVNFINRRNSQEYEKQVRDELEELNIGVSPRYKFRFGTYDEMKFLLKQVNDEGCIVPCIQNKFVLFLDSFDNLKVQPNGCPQFYAVLDE